jgi:hypothetical protein
MPEMGIKKRFGHWDGAKEQASTTRLPEQDVRTT